MKMFKYLLLQWLACFALVATMRFVFAQADQSGFVSIDCGLSESSNYTDPDTEIFYTSDAGFTDSGVNMAISSTIDESRKPFFSVRSFPKGKRNCYTLRPEKGKNNKYLIRARFLYGNYDGKNQLPQFDLYIGGGFWDTVSLPNADDAFKWEIIHTPSMDYIHVCLQRTGPTIPFISALELRPLNNTIYTTQSASGSLNLFARWDLGSETGDWVRYPDDVYDRIWTPFRPVDSSEDEWPNTTSLSTSLTVVTNRFQIPSAVMSTAATPNNSRGFLNMSWKPDNLSDKFYLYLHFAEVEKRQSDELRDPEIYLNGELWCDNNSLSYLQPLTIFSDYPESVQTKYELSIISAKNSTLPPIINAIEIYVEKDFNNPGTNDIDVAAIFGIKSYSGLTRNWQGDPCTPPDFKWEGLSCNYDDDYNPRIISLNLSSSGLDGSITPHIANLTSIQTLDLSNNNLSGNVPEFLAQLGDLTILNLAGNNFNGSIPAKLLEKEKQGLLSFSIDGFPNNIESKKKNKVILPVVESAVATFFLISLVFITVYTIRRRKKTVIKKVDITVNKEKDTLEAKTQQVTYSEVLDITNNFEKVLGKEGFDTVYHRFMGNTEVAVKMLNASLAQGDKEFQTEEVLRVIPS